MRGEQSGVLLRVPIDPNRFPLKGDSIEGELLWGNGEKVPVVVEAIVATVKEDLCRGCGDCQEICQYSAPELYEKGDGIFLSRIDEVSCKGCGMCASVCPSGAITLGHFTNKRMEDLLKQAIRK